MVGFCEHDIESSYSIKTGSFFASFKGRLCSMELGSYSNVNCVLNRKVQ